MPIGRSRGGLSTKIHALVDALGNPVELMLSPGQTNDLICAEPLLADFAPGGPDHCERNLVERFFNKLKHFPCYLRAPPETRSEISLLELNSLPLSSCSTEDRF